MNLNSALKYNKFLKILDLSHNSVTIDEETKLNINIHPNLIRLDLKNTKSPQEDVNWVENTLIKKSVKINLQFKKEI